MVTSSGSDTYSTIAAAMSSLKGPKHGGANIKVAQMMNDFKANISNWGDDAEVASYIRKTINRETSEEDLTVTQNSDEGDLGPRGLQWRWWEGVDLGYGKSQLNCSTNGMCSMRQKGI